jgi:hypothetical protein
MALRGQEDNVMWCKHRWERGTEASGGGGFGNLLRWNISTYLGDIPQTYINIWWRS